MKPLPGGSKSLEPIGNSESRSHDAEVVATLLAIPLAIVREELYELHQIDEPVRLLRLVDH
jgi:hypothetical protein